jgi:L-ascorbate metabolism protein UlaG (beta-lactamase superfamily)
MSDDSAAGRVTVTWHGHATVEIVVGGTRLLTDPVLRDRLGPLRRRADLPGAPDPHPPAVILLSHLHHDHADLPSLRSLAGAPVLTDRSNARWVRKQGLLAPDLTDERWHPVSDEVEVRLVPAVHQARPMPHRPNGAVGMLIRTPDLVVWFAGDTELYPAMDELPDLAGRPIDLALLPIGGWGPRLSPGHMGPDEAAEAALRVGAREVIPIHHGTLHPRGWPAGRLAWTSAPEEAARRTFASVSSVHTHHLPVGGTVVVG